MEHPPAKWRSSASFDAAGEHPPAKADVNSVDPDEPWRYECTECGSVAVYPTTSGTYTCTSCSEPLDVVYDKKHGSVARS